MRPDYVFAMCPTEKYWDPLGLAGGNEETIAKYQGAEIKHGRVAMVSFISDNLHLQHK
jgi:hypothetical protein